MFLVLQRQHQASVNTVCHNALLHFHDTVRAKKVVPLKLLPIFLLLVNLCNWKFSQLLPEHISTCLPILEFWTSYLNICLNCITLIGNTSHLLQLN